MKKEKNRILIGYLILTSWIVLWVIATISLILVRKDDYYFVPLNVIVFFICSLSYPFLYLVFRRYEVSDKFLNKNITLLLKLSFLVVIVVAIIITALGLARVIFQSNETYYWAFAVLFFAWFFLTLIKVVLTTKTPKSENAFINFVLYFNILK
ncbi:hypothetical protein BCF59_0545 [Mycoplasmopsis mustelae]|uniref:Uncharacterized protein n=1 Tax=Mycoplasmopsis mustelae TaxID=171289 RepID=A0A4R7UEF8_9BACT|nr:hypothetical protein [Mycoplasmopsis mustelae]TDV23554.1 hypothetical protein BCF59_0545 [Mycoplasmopsis mustelae]